MTYALSLPGVQAAGRAGLGSAVDLDYDLAGVEATWKGLRGEEAVSGWWPHADTAVVRALTAGSAGHGRYFSLLRRAGRLTLRTLVRLPAGRPTLRVEAGGAIEARLGDATVLSSRTPRARIGWRWPWIPPASRSPWR